jgi:hypothetical protein
MIISKYQEQKHEEAVEYGRSNWQQNPKRNPSREPQGISNRTNEIPSRILTRLVE